MLRETYINRLPVILLMCGICGFTWEDKKLLKEMMRSISYRGPDQDGMFFDKGVSLGHLRLSIIDLSEAGRQPMFNEEGDICVIFNGEIYNFQELRPELERKGYCFSSHSDTEVIIHAYEEYGEACVEKLNGMFAFAIWDSKKKKLFLARDRIGVKPLFYRFKKGKLIFASEIKAILQHEVPSLNARCLQQVIAYAYPVNGETLFEDIIELQSGHTLTFSSGKISIKKYWDLEVREMNRTESYYVETLRALLEASVKRRLISDVPLGMTLSGGLDSSTIVALASKLSPEPIKTFTIGFESVNTEFAAAKKVAEHCQTDHHEITMSHEDFMQGMVKVLWHMEFPISRPAMVPVYGLFKELSKHVTVSLVGEGADELFAGYNRYDAYSVPPPKSDPSYSEMMKKIQMPLKEKIEYVSSGVFTKGASDFFSPLLSTLPRDLTLSARIGKDLKGLKNDGSLLNRVLRYEMKTGIPYFHCNKLDRLSMAHGHECREPFLDYTIAEFAMTVPAKYKFIGSEKKILVQKVAKPLLPPEIVKRRKLPMVVPLQEFFEESFIETAESVLDAKRISKRPYYKVAGVQRLLDKAASGKLKPDKNAKTEDNAYRQLLFLVNLELWTQMFLESDVKKPNLSLSRYLH